MQQKNKVKVAYIQMTCSGSTQDNLQKMIQETTLLAQKGAQIIVTPELFMGPYFCQEEDEAHFSKSEAIPGETTAVLSELSQKLGVCIIASLFERRTAGVYHNTSLVLGPQGKILGKYRKMHIPDDPLYYEKYYFTPGDLGFPVIETPFGKIGLLICWDQWFPEAARVMALSGAEILIYPTAIGWSAGEPEKMKAQEKDAWETIQRSHAIANGVFVLSVNRVGQENKLNFWGNSFACGPMGEILHRSSSSEEESVCVECDLSLIESTRQTWPFLRDRRIDAFAPLLKRLNDE